jgi:flagellar hook-associated protein 3 FlgL
VVGARLNWIDFNTARYEKEAELAADQEASIGGADMADTITQLQQTMTVLEASQASFAKLSSLTLFSMIG